MYQDIMTSEMETIKDDATIVANTDLLCCELTEGAVILDLNSGVYYGLDGVGTFIWNLIQQPRSISSIVSAVLEEYLVDGERCRQDLNKLLLEMVQLKLIEVRNGQSS